MADLKLMALDAEDLKVISACVQDAVLKVGEIHVRPREKRVVLSMNRLAWEALPDDAGPCERRRACLHFDRVLSVRSHAIPRDKPETVLSLLAVTFAEAEAPAGTVDLVFAGGGVLRLQVECLEAQLADLGAAWAARRVPAHEL
jgi:hypothetical protein